ncbi:venom prothrombin activator oscutarin-C non-catalytic subunit [Exaiptasia diaphana]|uniref:Uncharacterized protein n=1 Tax=Exaiptasia diaphana TaxID=2652724 RepID=A0A913YSC9_EXADI|nr:venom prothrombin activator oscutarin-C non-catalytic subunit [Exaiptasia diaphana]XP_028517417.1 venom prothrombin activator oscutarin-C non-catalytic subunit [Exaiptasia diaphana]KXJ09243.1 Venom prothrombin activator oscutarin-C non-catalytic subunit [Exaiptasia diaphana]
MKTLMIYAVLFGVVVATTKEGNFFQDPQETVAKRGAVRKDILSTMSCRYLKTKGFLTRNIKLRKLCLTTFHCNDVLSKHSCKIIKGSNDCKKDQKLSLMYCRFTCNKCEVQQCTKSKPLGMQSKAIPDSKITASTIFSSRYRASLARLHLNKCGWAPTAKGRHGSWLKVDLSTVHTVTAIATQGSGCNSERMKTYRLQYSLDGSTFWNYQAGKVFKGNTDQNTVVKHDLNPPIRARFIKVVPKTWNGYPTMRMELYGCK